MFKNAFIYDGFIRRKLSTETHIVDYSPRNDCKNKHFPAFPWYKLAYKSVNDALTARAIITHYHWLASVPQFVELVRTDLH